MSNPLILAFQEFDSSHELCVTYSPDGVNWLSPAKSIAGIQVGSAPAIAAFNGKLYIAWQANDPTYDLYVTSSSDGVNWLPPANPIAGITIGSAPAIAAFNGKLYIAFKGNNSSAELYVTSSSDGVNWVSPAKFIDGIKIGSAPAMVAFQGQLYIAFQATNINHELYITSSSDGINWMSPAKCISGIQIGGTPGIAAFQGKLYLAFQANDSNHRLYLTTSSDGMNWASPTTAIANIETGSTPAICSFEGRLYITFQANDSNRELHVTSSSDGVSWVAPAKSVSGIEIGSAPAMSVGFAIVDASTSLLPPSASSSLLLSQSAFVSFPDVSVLVGATSVTLEVWINPLGSSATAPVLTLIGDTVTLAIGLVAGLPTATLSTGSNTTTAVSADAAIAAGQWVGLAVTYDAASATLALYVNGIEANAAENVPAVAAFQTCSAVLGANSVSNPGATLQAGVGRVLLWSEARSADDVLADFVNSGIIDPVAESTLELFLDFSLAPAVDQSGNGNVIAYENGPRPTILVPALLLDGVSWATVGSGSQLDFSGNTPFTIDGWFNAVAYGAAGTGTLVGRALPGAVEYLVEYIASGSGTGTLKFTRGGSSLSSAALPGDTWFHFAASYDAANSALYLYVNGNLQSSLIVTDTAPSADTDTLLGASAASGSIGNFFEGMIQNSRFWNVALAQDDIREWLFSQPISDSTLAGAFDFSVDPPVDTTGTGVITLNTNALVFGQSIYMDTGSFAATIGKMSAVDASYQAQTDEVPVPVPTSTTAITASTFAPLTSDWWSETRREQSWNAIVAALPATFPARRKARLRKQFDANFAEAARRFQEDPKLAQPITKTVTNGRVTLHYHTPRGDIPIFEGDATTVSDCQLWWIGFTATIIIGLIEIVFQLYTGMSVSTAVTTRIYNLMAENAKIEASMLELITLYAENQGSSALAIQALTVVGVVYETGLWWSLLKIALSPLSWWAIGFAITKIITEISTIEVAAAATLSQVIVWEAQIAYQLSSYTTSCPSE